MSEKLISADNLLKYTVLAGEIRNQYMEVVPAYFVRETPAADAVEVVRCYQCVNNPGISTRTKGMVWCRKFRSEVSPSGFCSYGDRSK